MNDPCEYCNGTGVVETDSFGPTGEHESIPEPCVCRDSLDDDAFWERDEGDDY